MSLEDDLQTFTSLVETQLHQRYPALQCRVRSHIDTATDESIPMLIFEVQAVTPTLQVAHVLVGDLEIDERAITALVAHFGEVLSQSVQRANR